MEHGAAVSLTPLFRGKKSFIHRIIGLASSILPVWSLTATVESVHHLPVSNNKFCLVLPYRTSKRTTFKNSDIKKILEFSITLFHQVRFMRKVCPFFLRFKSDVNHANIRKSSTTLGSSHVSIKILKIYLQRS